MQSGVKSPERVAPELTTHNSQSFLNRSGAGASAARVRAGRRRGGDLVVLRAAERVEKRWDGVAVPDDEDDVAGVLGFQAASERSEIRLAVGARRGILPDCDLTHYRASV